MLEVDVLYVLCAVALHKNSVLLLDVSHPLDRLALFLVVDVDALKQVLVLSLLFNDVQRPGGVILDLGLKIHNNLLILLFSCNVPFLSCAEVLFHIGCLSFELLELLKQDQIFAVVVGSGMYL